MLEFFRALFGTDFMPHLYCLRGDPGVLWLSVLSDLAIALAYYAIPLLLFQVVRKRPDPLLRRVALLFVGFIAACGTTHLLEVWTIWTPMYRLEGVAKAATAVISVTTAAVLVWLKPLILKMPSVGELEAEIAERRRAQEEARGKDERFRTYVEGVRDYAIFMIDLDGIIQTWNMGAERIHGYKSEEIVGNHFSCFYTGEDLENERPQQALETANEIGQSEQEGWRTRKDGSRFWAKTMLRPSFDVSGMLRGFTQITRDLTESREIEAKYQMILESAPDAMVMYTPSGRIVYVNRRFEEMFGYRRAEILGKSTDILLPEQTRAERAESRRRFFEAPVDRPMGESGEHWCVRRDGSELVVESSLSPLETLDGPVALAAIRDISERRRARDEAREREDRFRSFVDGVEDYAIYMIDPEGNVLTWNHGAERMKGYTAEEMIGRNFALFYSAEEREQGKPAAALQAARETGGYVAEGWRYRKDGSCFLAQVNIRPLWDGVGGLRGFSKVTRDLTETRELEARYQMLLEATPDAIVIVKSDDTIEFVNKQAEKVFGYEREELVGQDVNKLAPPRTRELQAAYVQRLLGGLTHPSPEAPPEFFGQRRDGSEFPLDFSVTPLATQRGQVLLFGVRDLTERRNSEARFQALLESAPDAMVISGSDGLIELTNLEAERMFGYARGEMVGQPVQVLIPSDLHSGYERDSHLFFQGQGQREMGAGVELRARRKDGVEFPVEIRFSPLQGPKGTSMTAAIRDVTERKKSETRFRALLESAPDAMVIVGSDGAIRLANLQTEKLFGYDRAELIGKSVDIMVPLSARGLHAQHRNGYFESPKPRAMGPELDLMALRKDGTEFPVEISLSPLEGPDGVSVTAAIRDITERKRVAQELTEKVAELRQSNEALEQFAHIASHDLQEPLRMVASYTQLLARRYVGRLDKDADEFISYAIDGTKRMKRLIEDLLLYSRAGQGIPPIQEFSSELALSTAIRNLSQAIKESGAEVTYDAMPLVVGDELQLVQIFQNLISNAIKYRGEKTPEIHVSADMQAKEWVFSVADNGIGIEPQYHERIFVIFQRLHRVGKYEGTGIGLAICKRILQQQGGRIWVESEPGSGSVFHFSLPMR